MDDYRRRTKEKEVEAYRSTHSGSAAAVHAASIPHADRGRQSVPQTAAGAGRIFNTTGEEILVEFGSTVRSRTGTYLARRLFPRSQRYSAALTGASRLFASATMIQEIEFAPDSPL
jgi:hypothetical protein